jgi:hypothetical protein
MKRTTEADKPSYWLYWSAHVSRRDKAVL